MHAQTNTHAQGEEISRDEWVDLELIEPLASSERIVLSDDGSDASRALFFLVDGLSCSSYQGLLLRKIIKT